MMPVVIFNFGAMENWGLMTFKVKRIMYNEDLLTVEDRAGVAQILAHELAHQWTGNLVTMHWWNELWLNEGITTYFQYSVPDLVDPTMGSMEQFLLLVVPWAMKRDDGRSPEPLVPESNQVNLEGEVTRQFRSAYNKGACMVVMMKGFMGPENFMRGLRNYLKERSYKAATQDHLWAHMQKEITGVNVPSIKETMDTWTKQSGYPVVSVIRNYADGSMTLRQESSRHENSPLRWWIHIDYAFADGDGSNAGDFWMGKKK